MLIVAGALQIAGKVEDASIAFNYFGASAALYFGRKVNFGGSSSTSKDEPEKLPVKSDLPCREAEETP